MGGWVNGVFYLFQYMYREYTIYTPAHTQTYPHEHMHIYAFFKTVIH